MKLRCMIPSSLLPILVMRTTFGAQLPGKASGPSERLIPTPLNVQWKVKWLYRPLIITQAELESQTSHEYKQTLKWQRVSLLLLQLSRLLIG